MTDRYARCGWPTVYVAGPDLFHRRTWPAHVDRVSAACAQHNLSPIFPAPPERIAGAGITRYGSREEGQAIFRTCIKLVDTADMILANLTPFRGAEPDSGTVFEMATAIASRKIAVGYIDGTRLNDELWATIDDDGALLDENGCTIERFGMPINLMPAYGATALVCRNDGTALELAIETLRAKWDKRTVGLIDG